jgi:hypothetical protein
MPRAELPGIHYLHTVADCDAIKRCDSPLNGGQAHQAIEGAQMATLYERLGGPDAITAVVDAFVARAAGDDRINSKFGRTDIPHSRRTSPTSCVRRPAVPAPTPAGACGRRTTR